MNDNISEKNRQNSMFLFRRSTLALRNMWLVLFVGSLVTMLLNPGAFKTRFFAGGLFIYTVCALFSTFALQKKSSPENIIPVWYFRFISELLFMFLIITYTGREKSVMIIGVGAMLLRFVICRPNLKEVLGISLLITLAETTILLTAKESSAFLFSRHYLTAVILFWFTTLYVYWAFKQHYREKDNLIRENIENQVLIKELQMEKKLHISEKFATIGQLAAGLAHEIRNPLTAVQGFVQLLRNRELGDKEREYLDIIHEELQRVSKLVGEFLLLAKPAAPHCSIQSAAAMVREAVNLMRSEAILKDISLDTDIEKDCFVNVDKEQIKQVVINLVKNALEVMGPGKTIILKVTPEPEYDQCLIAVKDEGPGIAADDLKKVFDPFFTTKDEGTGLGLAVSFRIVQNHGGKLSVQSTPGKGSVFTIELPAAAPSSGGGL